MQSIQVYYENAHAFNEAIAIELISSRAFSSPSGWHWNRSGSKSLIEGGEKKGGKFVSHPWINAFLTGPTKRVRDGLSKSFPHDNGQKLDSFLVALIAYGIDTSRTKLKKLQREPINSKFRSQTRTHAMYLWLCVLMSFLSVCLKSQENAGN